MQNSETFRWHKIFVSKTLKWIVSFYECICIFNDTEKKKEKKKHKQEKIITFDKFELQMFFWNIFFFSYQSDKFIFKPSESYLPLLILFLCLQGVCLSEQSYGGLIKKTTAFNMSIHFPFLISITHNSFLCFFLFLLSIKINVF